LPQYRSGTVSVTNGSPNVVGQTTSFLANVSAGDLFVIQGEGIWSEILSVTDDTHLTLKSNYVRDSKTAVAYAIQTDFTAQQNYPMIAYGDTDSASLISLAFNSIDQKLNNIQTALADIDGITLTGDLDIDLTAFSQLKVRNGPFRNKLDNCDFLVMERVTSPVVMSAPNSGFFADRWQINNQSSAPVTVTRIAAPTGFSSQNVMQFDYTPSGGGYMDLYQRFDGEQMAGLEGGDQTFSFELQMTAGVTVTAGLAIWCHQTLDSGPTDWMITSQGFDHAPLPVDGSINKIATVIAAGSSNKNWKNGGYLALRINHAGASVISFKLGALQLESGKIVNDFDIRPEAVERLICARCFRKANVHQRGPASAGSQIFTATQPLMPPMRRAPDIALFSQSRTNVSAATVTAPTLDHIKTSMTSSASGDTFVDDIWTLDSEPG
jgi:hypothetical protein